MPLITRTSFAQRSALATLGLLALSLPAGAQTTYTSSAAFFAALGSAPFTTEGYEGPAVNSLINNGGTLDGLTYSAFPTGTQGRIDNNYNKFDNQSLALQRGTDNTSFFFGGDSFTVTFPTPVKAVAVFFNANHTTNSSNGDFFIQTSAGTANTGLAYDQSTFYFAGLISNTAFTTATIGSSSAGPNVFNADNLTYSPAAVPEASTTVSFGLLLALGLGGVVVAAKRKKATAS